MWFLVICVIIWITLSVILGEILERFFSVNEIESALMSIPIAFIASFCIFAYGVHLYDDAEKELEFSHKINITALEDNSNIEGYGYYLGVNNINEEQYYYFMSDTSKGEKMYKVKASKSYINEGDYSPHIMVYDLVHTNKFAKWIERDRVFRDEAEYIFYVPDKTVTRNFNIDMK